MVFPVRKKANLASSTKNSINTEPCLNPKCTRTFKSSRAVHCHLKHPHSSCHQWWISKRRPPNASSTRVHAEVDREERQDISDSELDSESASFLETTPAILDLRDGTDDSRGITNASSDPPDSSLHSDIRVMDESSDYDTHTSDDENDTEEWGGINYLSRDTSIPEHSSSTATSSQTPSKPVVEHFPGAAKTFGRDKDLFESISSSAEGCDARKSNPFYPFSCEMDWQVAQWLSQLGVSQAKIDEFFKLQYVRSRPLSFTSARQLRGLIETLPSPPRWLSRRISIDGGSTRHPLTLYYRDGLECFRFLFSNPLFRDFSDYCPRKIWENDEKTARIYNEIMTGTLVWDVQGKIRPGETLGLVLLGSDKTHLTNHIGDKECHCVYISCGNIKKSVRSKAAARCWMLLAQIPVAKFEPAERQGVLSDRLYHACLDIALKNLKECSRKPKQMSDAFSKQRLVRTILVAHLADLPEQRTIACVSASQSPLSLASSKTYGEPKMQSLRHGSYTLSQIQKVLKQFRDTDWTAFMRAAKARGLNGVVLPFWRDWKFADPCRFLVTDILHTIHKAFQDHALAWGQKLLGKREFDSRIKCLQPRIGFRHFSQGISRFRQHTGREQRDLQRVFISVVAGHDNVKKGALKAFRAILDFAYVAQYESHSAETLQYLEDYLKTFHDSKSALKRAGIRNGPRQKGKFNIPKFELWQHVSRFVKLVGTVEQFSSEITERCHCIMAKTPYENTNHRDFLEQMCRYTDREEKVLLFQAFLEYSTGPGVLSINDPLNAHKNMQKSDPTEGKIRNVVLPRSSIARSLLAVSKAVLSHPGYSVPRRQTWKNVAVDVAAAKYKLPDLRAALADFYSCYALDERKGERISKKTALLNFLAIHVWETMRLRLPSVQDEDIVMPNLTLQARPPSSTSPYGRCDFVLIKEFDLGSGVSNIQGHIVAQIRMILQPVLFSDHEAPLLAYVELFKPAPRSIGIQNDGAKAHVPDDVIEMFRVVRMFRASGERWGEIIPLERIWRTVELIPKFGKKCSANWTSDTSTTLALEFYVNSFADKQTYQAVY